jgi:hypothetical protein
MKLVGGSMVPCKEKNGNCGATRKINPGPSTDFEEGRWLTGFESPWFLARAEEKRYCNLVAVCY